LDNISLTIENGEFVSVMGPSGCGKSTLLNIVGLLDNPTGGILRIGGVDVAGMNDRQQSDLRNRKLGFIFQNFHLVPSLTIQGNVELPMNYRRGKLPFDKRKRASEVLDIVGLSHRTKHYPTQLSGGQCQRVAIARALMGQPEIILADEPTGNLDSKMGAEIMEILKKLNHDGVTIVMVTHDEKIAEQTTRIIRFLDGKIINA
jgi:putative ABC transport system ATP-binding protein